MNWSREQLAEASGVPLRTIADFELTNTSPRNATVTRLLDALQRAGIEFLPENGGDAGVRRRRLRPGDRVRFRESSNLRLSFNVKKGEVGTITYVEPHPPATGPTYRVDVQFQKAAVKGVFKYDFDLVTGVEFIPENGGGPGVRLAKKTKRR